MSEIAVGQRVRYYSAYAMKHHEGEVVEIEADRAQPRARVRVVDRQGRTTRVWMRLSNLDPVPRATSETSRV